MFRWLAILLLLICGSEASAQTAEMLEEISGSFERSLRPNPFGGGISPVPQMQLVAQQKVVPPPGAIAGVPLVQPPAQMPPIIRRPLRSTVIPNLPVKRDHRGDPLPQGALVRYGSARLRHGSEPLGLGFSHDGKLLGSISRTYDGIRLWDPATGKERFRYNLPATHASFAQDGSVLVVDENRCRVWIPSANTCRDLPENTLPEGTRFVAMHPNCRSFAACSQHNVHQIDFLTGKLIRELKCPADQSAVRVVFSPDGRWLAGAGQKTGIWLWDLQTGKRVRTYHSEFDFPEFAFNADGTRLAIAAEQLHIYSTHSEEPIEGFKGVELVLRALRFSADGKWLFAIAEEGTVYQFNSENGEANELENSPDVDLRAPMAIAPDGALAAATDDTGGIRVWDPKTGMGPEEDRLPSLSEPAFSTDGKTVWCLAADGRIHSFEAATGKPVKVSELPVEEAAFYSWNHRARRAIAVSGGDEFELHVIDLDTNRVIQKFNASMNGVMPFISFCVTDQTRAALFGTGIVNVVNIANGKTIRSFKVGSADAMRPSRGAISPDGRLLAMNSQPLSVWEISTGKKRFEVNSLLDAEGAAFSPDGRSLAAWDGQGNILAVDVRLGTTIRRMQLASGAEVPTLTVAFSAGGKRLAAGDHEGSITVWDLASGDVLSSFERHDGAVTGLVFSPDGATLASTSQDGTVLIWSVDDKAVVKLNDPAVGGLGEAFRLLASSDAATAQRALEYLYRRPTEAIQLCNEKFPTPTATPAKKISKLIAELDSDDYPVRLAAVKDLEAIGGEAAFALRTVAEKSSNPEARKLATEILARFDSITPRAEDLALIRVVELLENIGTAEAKAVLANWATGPSGHRVTIEASSALSRMKILQK